MVLTADNLKAVEDTLAALGKQVNQFSWSKQGDLFKAELSLLVQKKDYPIGLLKRLAGFPGIQVESIG